MGISWDKARRLLRLVHEAHELGASSDRCRRHVLSGLSELIGAPLSLFVVDPFFSSRVTGPIRDATFCGVEKAPALVRAVVEQGRSANPVLAHIIRMWATQARGDVITVHRADCVSDHHWRTTPYVADYVLPEGWSDFLASARSHGTPDECTGLALVRARGDHPFTDEDRNLLDLFHRECGSLLVPPEVLEGRKRISPRMGQTLDLLMTGAADKQIADELGVSYHTVRQYVKSLYRTFDVRSRGELVATVRGARAR
jgi:DNA-binding CsgD family transcriptional regulator